MLKHEEGKRAIIYGVAGQDGSYLAELLLKLGYTVLGAKRRSSEGGTSKLRPEVFDNPNFKIVNSDVTDLGSVIRVVQLFKPDYIYNLAAQSHVGNSFNESLSSVDVTLKGCVNILEAVKLVAPNCKVYQASSSEMFGNSYDINPFGVKYQNEQTKMSPCSPYAVAKLASHNFLSVYRSSFNIWACSGILFNHESERRGIEFVTRKVTRYVGHLANHLNGCSRFRRPERLRLGDITSERDWGYAPEYVEAMVLMMQADTPDDYVIATGVTTPIEKFVERCFSMIGENYKEHVIIDEQFKRPNDVKYLLGDASKAKAALGWKPKCTMDNIAVKMVNADIADLWNRGPDNRQEN